MPYSATILKLNKEIILIASNKNYSYTRKGKIIKISQPSDKIIIILKFFFVALFMPNCQFCMVLKLLSAHKNRQNNSMINEYGNSFILFYFFHTAISIMILLCVTILWVGMNILHVANLFNMQTLQQLHPNGMIILNKIKEHKSLFSTHFSPCHAIWTLRVAAVWTLRVAVRTLRIVVLRLLALLTLIFILQWYFSTP